MKQLFLLIARLNANKIVGWSEQIKDARDRSLFWHWVWLEADQPMTGHMYNIMKRTRHQYITLCAVLNVDT